jgi:Novel STAND NTPase 1
MTTLVLGQQSPFKGLSAFDDSERDALLFFGRERETEIVVANVLASRLTVLYGPSGVGKSSLLRAGVVQQLRRLGETEPLAVAIFSGWAADPVGGVEEAARAAIAHALGGDPGDAPGGLADRLEAWTAALGGELCLVLDQLEELFLYHPRGGAFADELPELVTRPRLRVNVLLGIRDDALARLDVLKARIPGLFTNSLGLDRLDREAGRRAVLGPLERWNAAVGADEAVEIEPALLEAILTDVAAGRIEPGVAGRGAVAESAETQRIETPYLQLVLQRLWDVERERG